MLYLVGGGDMTLAADEGDPEAVLGRAGLGDLARQTASALEQRGVDSVTLRLDDSLFTGASESPGWGYWGVGDGFVAPIEAIAVDLGEVEGQIATSLRPAVDAAVIFRDALREAGITVADGLERDEAPAEATPVAEVRSAPLRDLLAVMMAQSDNTLAEVFGRLVAIARGESADFAGAGTAVLAGSAAAGVDVSGTTLADTSGLNSANAISPALLVEVLRAANSDPELTELARVLPVSGLVGTLADRDLPPGAVRGKTGTLEDVVSLAGYVTTQDGRPLAFAVMADGVEYGGIWAARARIDEFLTDLSECGCRAETDDAATDDAASDGEDS